MDNMKNIKFEILNKLFNMTLHLYTSYESLVKGGRRLLLFEYEEHLCGFSTLRFNKEEAKISDLIVGRDGFVGVNIRKYGKD